MRLRVVIDEQETKPLTGKDARFASILEFVADSCEVGTLYLFEDWALLDSVGVPTESFKPEQPRVVYLSNREFIANGRRFETADGRLPLHVPIDELVFSRSHVVHRAALEQQGLSPTTALLTLAAAGVDIALPNATFLRERPEEVRKIRERIEEERQTYLIAVAGMADEAYERLDARDYASVYEWAWNEASLKILPKAMLLQLRLSKLDRTLLQRAGVQFWKEGVPAIGKAFVDLGGRAALRALAEETIRVLAGTLAKNIEQRRIPEACYAFRLSSELAKL
jgi:hypothetical protein